VGRSQVTNRWEPPKRVGHPARFGGYQTPLARCTEVNREGEPGYVRVRNGIFGMKSVLIPVQFVERDVKRKTLVLK
jgi:hypothetical protein